MHLFALAYSAQAWHGHVHHLTGHMLDLLNDADAPVRQWINNALAAGAFDIESGCDMNSWASACSFPDDIKASTQQMSDWHWNDIVGHISYYTDESDLLQVAETDLGGNILDPGARSTGKAACSAGTGCYGANAVTGLRQTGELRNVLLDIQANLHKTTSTTQAASPLVAYSRGLMTRFAMHFAGDANMPLHNGSMFSKAGLDQHCCPPNYSWTEVEGACTDGLQPPKILPAPAEDACTNHYEWPRKWCRMTDDYETGDLASEGDRGGNLFYLSSYGPSNYWGPFRNAQATTNLHWTWDAVFGMFESTRALNPDEPHLECNEMPDGTLKKFDFTSNKVNPATGAVSPTTDTVYQNEVRDAGFYDTPEFDASISCHAKAVIADYPRSTIKGQIQDIINDGFQDFYTGAVQAPGIAGDLFDPDTTDIDRWQRDMNFIRDWFIYRPFAMTGTKFSGAECSATGAITTPTNWFYHQRKLSRAIATLSGYRLNAFMNGLAEGYVVPDTQIRNGTLNEVCAIQKIGVETCGPCSNTPPNTSAGLPALGSAIGGAIAYSFF